MLIDVLRVLVCDIFFKMFYGEKKKENNFFDNFFYISH